MSPEREQFDSAREDVEEDDGVTTGLDTDLGVSTGEEMEVSRHSGRAPSADGCCRRNRAMWRERARARRDFRAPKNKCLSFPLFRETTKEDAISYQDWHGEIEDTLAWGHNATKVK